MPRPVYLTVYNSPLVPAHWALWVPRASPSNVRKRIHATGDARNGFTVAFERNYDIDATSRTYQLLALVQVLNHYAVDVTGDGSCTPDQTAHDYLEQVAFRIPAPGAKLVSATSSGPRQRVTISSCQTWIRQVIVALVQNGVMYEAAIHIIDTAPKN